MGSPMGGALGVSGFALGVRASSAFSVVLSSHKFGKVSGVIIKGVLYVASSRYCCSLDSVGRGCSYWLVVVANMRHSKNPARLRFLWL